MTKFLDDTAASFFVRFVGAIHGPAARLEIDNLVDAATTERENQIGLEIKSGDETTVAAVAVHVHRIAGNPEGIGTSIRVIGSDIKAKIAEIIRWEKAGEGGNVALADSVIDIDCLDCVMVHTVIIDDHLIGIKVVAAPVRRVEPDPRWRRSFGDRWRSDEQSGQDGDGQAGGAAKKIVRNCEKIV